MKVAVGGSYGAHWWRQRRGSKLTGGHGGFRSYACGDATGSKDSHDSAFHELAGWTDRLVQVQGSTYTAARGRAPLSTRHGDDLVCAVPWRGPGGANLIAGRSPVRRDPLDGKHFRRCKPIRSDVRRVEGSVVPFVEPEGGASPTRVAALTASVARCLRGMQACWRLHGTILSPLFGLKPPLCPDCSRVRHPRRRASRCARQRVADGPLRHRR
jgi:hypothetical protein